MTSTTTKGFAAVFFVSAMLGASAMAAQPSPAEEAQRLIFNAPHLRAVKAPSDIYYSYSVANTKKEKFGPGFKDSVRLHVENEKSDSTAKDTTLFMYTGERQRDPMRFQARTSNPVILMFLEQDLWDMRQRIGGRAEYFKARVAEALRNAVNVEETKIEVDGKQVSATRVTFKPFEKDPNAEKLELFRTKVYELTLSEAVPGEVVELRTAVFDPASTDNKPVMEEKLSYDHISVGG
jgi:hypothetical protein